MSYKRLRTSGLQRNSDSSRMRDAGKRRVDPRSNPILTYLGADWSTLPSSLSLRALVDLAEP